MFYIVIALGIIIVLALIVSVANQFKQQQSLARFDAHLQTLQQLNQDSRSSVTTQILQFQQAMLQKIADSQLVQTQNSAQLKEHLQQAFADHRTRFDERQLAGLKILQDSLQQGTNEARLHVKEALADYAVELGKRVELLTATTDQRLKEISNQVDKRLTAGFEKTTETFTDVIKRLALIDAAQKQISQLSDSVMSLQEVLNDKRSRGAFGEVQLSALIRNVIPEQNVSFQHTLSNGKRADCILFLPEPTGNIVIDAKFPLESFRQLMDNSISDANKKSYEQQFRQDIKKHIQDIAEKYILPGETTDGAVMFIPAEAIFAEIHAHYPDLVEVSQRAKVWMVSPTTMMAILTTASAVLKDVATRKQLHIIQEHLHNLGNDFSRFQERMDSLTKHIALAHTQADQVQISAKKITARFNKIEKVELQDGNVSLQLDEEKID